MRVLSLLPPPEEGGISLKKLSESEAREFAKSDAAEWESISGTRAVRVHPPEEGRRLRQAFPSRVVSSRMVRRWGPQEGVFAPPKAKSR
eukprot:1120878-Pyramimonas_sp.AAC.1